MTSMPSLPAAFQVDDVDVFIEGGGEGSDGQDTIVMVHGWPDTYRLWDAQVEFFKKTHRCVRFTLPGFDVAKPRRLVTLDEMASTIKRIVETASPGRPVTLMMHDWGCVFGNLFAQRHPALVSRVVAVDVGDASSAEHVKSLSLPAKLMVVTYQGLLSLAWRIGGKLGDGLSRFMAGLLNAPGAKDLITSAMNYPYFMAFNGGFDGYDRSRPAGAGFPVLFFYGTEKPFLFHSPGWAEALAQRAGCKVVSADCGHWVMRDQADMFNDTVAAWLKDSEVALGLDVIADDRVAAP